ncbi:MAG: ribosome-associated translation inhibitor RaiA [Chthoniobacterales bacterium]|nr:ribosome-associated translation inhibitor RaiA [Chthoniobacterales bacterium]
MQIHLSPRHLTLTASIHAYVAEKISHLENMTNGILGAHVVLLHDESKKKPYTVKVHLGLPGPDIHAEDSESDLYAAIDRVVDKLARQLRKRKTRLQSTAKHHNRRATEARKRGVG